MFGEAYRRYVLFILTLVYTLNYLDRGLITLLLPNIQADLKLTDTQLGFLTGIAFGLFYATLGIPLARWADRGDRGSITSLAIGLWGITVMGCLFVSNFKQLVAARIAAAVGEAGCMPPTYSLVGDYFPRPAERTRAISLYMLASPLSVLLSFVLGGWLAQRQGWRMTFFWMGVPALLVAAVVKLTVRDPRTQAGDGHLPAERLPRLDLVLGELWRRPALRHLTLAVILLLTVGAGLGPWYAAFLSRYHGLSTETLGLSLGLIFSIGGIVGITLGGYLSGGRFVPDEKAQMRVTALTVACLSPAFTLFLLFRSTAAALTALAVLWTLFNFFIGPTFTLLQRLVVPRTRATTLALVMMLANLIGMGVGPQIVGVLSDLLRTAVGFESLRYAMLALSLVALWAAYHVWRVGRYVTVDLDAASIA